MNSLYVYYENQRIGTFTRDENLISSFTYDEQWQMSEQSFPLSLAMPLSQQTFGNKITLSFFENLLPEGDVRDTFAQIGLNQFTLLEDELGIKKGVFTQRLKDIRELILAHKDIVLERVMDNHPQAKIPKRISELIVKRAKGLSQQGV